MTRLSLKQTKGFTLLEVIVALGIVAVGILAVSRAMSSHAGALISAEERMIGYWVASNQLEYARIAKTSPATGDTVNRYEMSNRIWYTRQTVKQTAEPRLFRVDIRVYSDKHQQEQVGFLFGYLKRP